MGRFRVVGQLGVGSFGAVHSAWDAERRELVALKTLTRLEPTDLYQFKNEFRTLAALNHPNLVRLHTLFAEASGWFFTMELLEAVPFDRFVRPGGSLDGERLRNTLPQLLDAVDAIHSADKLHRDLKPSNVLVTNAGRLVVLDLGLAAEGAAGRPERALSDEGLVGTPAYMAPEQAAQQLTSSASDYYAVGVMLYEALTGRLPFEGRAGRVMAEKQHRRAPRPEAPAGLVPDTVMDLCVELLETEAVARPHRAQVRARLSTIEWDAQARTFTLDPATPVVQRAELLLGRERELQQLRALFTVSQAERPVVVDVCGPSGMGKSALLRRFLGEVRALGAGIVLEGRCYEREVVPYRGFDSIADQLACLLRELPEERALALMPQHMHELARIFPVLRRIPALFKVPQQPIHDPRVAKQRAYEALGALVQRLGQQGPLVMFIDDLQWICADALAMLRHLLSDEAQAPWMLVLARRAPRGEGHALRKQLEGWVTARGNMELQRLEVGPLDAAGCLQLAHAELGSEFDPIRVQRVADESAGSPFFLGELARLARQAPDCGLNELSLEGLLRRRREAVSEDAQRMLELLAVAGRPLSMDVCSLALTETFNVGAAADALYDAHLVRSEPRDTRPALECFHDRVREGVVESLAGTHLTSLHRRLALALEGSRDTDLEALAQHWAGAGDRGRATDYALSAAEHAAATLAFERSARLCQNAFGWGTASGETARRLHVLLGQGYEALGRGEEAAAQFLAAAEGAEEAEALQLRRRAAERLMMCGEVDRGSKLILEVLRALDMPTARTTAGAIASFFWQRLQSRTLRLDFARRSEDAIGPLERARVDASWSCAMGLAMTDNLRGADYQTRHVQHALKLGDPWRAARGIILEYGFVGRLGARTRKRTEALHKRAYDLCEELNDPYLRGVLATMRSNVAYLQGELQEAESHGDAAVALLEGVGRDATFHQANAMFFTTNARIALGRFAKIARILPPAIALAKERHDVHTRVLLESCWQRLPLYLMRDDPSGSVECGRDLRASYAGTGYHLAHIYMRMGEVLDATYVGDFAGALKQLEDDWHHIKLSQSLTVASLHSTLLFSRTAALLALASLSAGSERRGYLARAHKHQRTIASLEDNWPNASVMSTSLSAGIAAVEGDLELAATRYRVLLELTTARDSWMFNACAQYRLGRLEGGDAGARRMGVAREAMIGQAVVRHEPLLHILTPGQLE